MAVVEDHALAAVDDELLAQLDDGLLAPRDDGHLLDEQEADVLEVVLLTDGDVRQLIEAVEKRRPVLGERPEARDVARILPLLLVEELPLRVGRERRLRDEARAPALRNRELVELAQPAAATRQLDKRLLCDGLRQFLQRSRLHRPNIDLALTHGHLNPPAARRQRAAHHERKLFEQNLNLHILNYRIDIKHNVIHAPGQTQIFSSIRKNRFTRKMQMRYNGCQEVFL